MFWFPLKGPQAEGICEGLPEFQVPPASLRGPAEMEAAGEGELRAGSGHHKPCISNFPDRQMVVDGAGWS